MSKGSNRRPTDEAKFQANWQAIFGNKNQQHLSEVPASLIEGIMTSDKCGHPFCDCKDVCKEAK